MTERAYLAYTPFHLLVSLALQHRDGRPRSTLLFGDEACILREAPALGQLLCEEFDLVLLPRVTGPLRVLGPVRSRRATRETLVAVGSLPDLRSLYIFNGQNRPALSVGKHYDGSVRFSYVEDGLDAYLPVNLRAVGPIHRRLHVLAFGWSHPHLIDMTEALPFSHWNVLFPEATRVRVRPEEITPIPAECLRWAVERMQAGLPDLDVGRPVTHLYLLGVHPSGRSPDASMFALRTWVNSVRHEQPSASLAVKPHPRETNRRLLDALHRIDGLEVLPSWMPAEMLAPSLAEGVTIRCDLTTFVMTSRVLLPGRVVELEPGVAIDAAAMLHRWDPTITRLVPGAS
jgi:hypothetical protein